MSSVHLRPERIRARRTTSTECPIAVGAQVDLDPAGSYVVLDLDMTTARQLLEQLARAVELVDEGDR